MTDKTERARAAVYDVFGCLADRCAPVPLIKHALHNSSLTPRGAVVHYDCEAGYQPTGPMDIVCDGQRWSSLSSRCTGKYTTLFHYTLRRLRHCPSSSANSRSLCSPEVIVTVLHVLNICTFYYDTRRYFSYIVRVVS